MATNTDVPTPTGTTTRSFSDPLAVGDGVAYCQPVTDETVTAFAQATGDANPLHLDDEYATETMFGERIAHGMLSAGLISAALARLPGTVVYVSQDLRFVAPVPVESTVDARCTITDIEDDRYTLDTECVIVDGETVLTGTATVLLR
jgi:acyl dehydratase